VNKCGAGARCRLLTAILVILLPVWLPAQEDSSAKDKPASEAPAEVVDQLTEDSLFEDPLLDDPLFADPFSVGTGDSETEAVDLPAGDQFFADPFGTALDSAIGDIMDLEDLDSLFATDGIIDEARAEDVAVGSPLTDLLVTEGVRWGGRIRGSVSADFSWGDVWTSDFGPFDPTSQSLDPSIGADLFFDARPEAEFRAFGKLNINTTTDGGINIAGLALTGGAIDPTALPEGWTSEENEDGDTEIRDGTGTVIITIPAAGATDENTDGEPEEDPGNVGTPPGLEIVVFELFADYVWKDQLFFRFGKHTIKWGTGYFFSPADVLNLTAVDAEDPTADREGPVSLRIQYPFGITGNAYLYTILNAGAEPLDVAVAPKVEFVVGNGEIAIGGYYQRTLAPRLVTLYSASIGEVDVFGEGVLLYGSDRIFVRPSRDQSAAAADPEDDLNLLLDTYQVEDALFAQATAGFRYIKEWEDSVSLALIGQYFFNGEGYADETAGLLPAAARLQANAGENGLTIADAESQPEGYEDPPALTFGDITNWGRHYLGLTVSLSNIFDTDLGLTAFGLVNMSDWSGIVTPAISYRFLDRFSISGSARFTFGEESDEFTNPGSLFSGGPAEPTFGITISLSMPGGSF